MSLQGDDVTMRADGPVRNRLAGWAMGLGIGGLVLAVVLGGVGAAQGFFPMMSRAGGLVMKVAWMGAVLGLAGVVLGIVAVRVRTRRGMAITGIVTGALAVVLLVIWAPRLTRAQHMVRETVAMTNMRALLMSMRMSAVGNGSLPDDLADALGVTPSWGMRGADRGLKDPRLGKPATAPPAGDKAALKAWLEQECDFYYAGGGLNPSKIASEYDIVVFYDKGLDPQGSRLVIFWDAHSERIAPGSPALQAFVDAQNKLRAELGMKPLPAGLVGPVEK